MRTRRKLLVGSAAAALSLLGWAILVEPGRVRVRKVDLSLPGWPPALDGLRVAVIGDVHAGAPHVGVDALRALVVDVNRGSPDVVVLLGDYVIHGVVGGSFVEPEVTAEILGGLRAPGGIVAVLGNHDWWYDGFRVRRALEGRGIVVLENDAHRVVHQGTAFWLAGLEDLWTGRPDIPGTLANIPPGAPVLLLTHSPDVFPAVPPRVALTLAAHTHGGQVRMPPFPAPVVPSRYGSRYAAGHVIEGRRHLFVTTGVGTSILPVRFAVPPEVVILVLHPDRFK
jgi:predicted MPP superfamily phosphohydrolase